MAIAFVASAEGNNDTDATSYSISPIPTGADIDDVCVIVVACPTTTAGAVTFTGWTQLFESIDTGHRSSVWYRVVQGSDTTSSTFTFDPPGTPEGIAWVSSCYSGVDFAVPFIAHSGATSLADADLILATPSVTNTDANAWWVSAAAVSEAVSSSDSAYDWTASSGTERNDIDAGETTSFHAAAIYDSNGTTTTGAKSNTHTLGNITATTGDLTSWIGILKPQSGDYGRAVNVFQSDVTVEPGTNTAYTEVRIPAIIRTPAGTLMAFAEGRHVAGDFGNIDILGRRSTDGGATWGDAFKVKENGTNTVGNPAPVINGAGHIVLMHIKQDTSGGSNRYPYVTKSTDDGLSWSASTDLSSLRPSGWTWFATGPGHGIRTTSGRLIIPINGNHATSGYHAGCLYSDDDGDTWSISSTVSDNTGVNNYNEATIAETPGGTLVMLCRNEGGSGSDRIRVISSDNGATWGSPSDTGMTSTNVEGSVVRHKDRLIFSCTDDADSRHNMVLRSSTNDGTSWTTMQTIWRLEDAAYSDMAITSGNSVGLLYERGNANAYENITFIRVPISDITMVGTPQHAETVADATSLTVTKPSGVASDDVLLAVFTCNSVTITPPSGFTQFDSDSTSNLFTRLYWKTAGVSEPADYQFTASPAGPIQVSLTAWRGCDIADPIANSSVSSNSTTATEPTTTPLMTSNDSPNGRMFYVRSAFISSATPISFANTGSDSSFYEEVFENNQTTAANTSRTHALYTWNHGFEGTAEPKAGIEITATGTETLNTQFTFALRAVNRRDTYWDYSVARAATNAPKAGVGAKAQVIG